MNIRSASHSLATAAVFTVRELSEASKNDPALALRLSATQLSDQLLKKVNPPIKDAFDKNVVPVVRGALLAVNTARAVHTFNSPASTPLDKFVDVTAVASDLVGFVGGVAVMTGSKYAGLGTTLMGISYAVDAVAHGYRSITHIGERVSVWQTELREAKEAQQQQEKQQQGQQPPTAPPAPPEVEMSFRGSAEAAKELFKGQQPILFGGVPIKTAGKPS